MKTLVTLRHAKSSWDDPGLRDFDRTLARRGKRDAPRMGTALKDAGVGVDRVVSSPAARARETAELAARAAGFDAPVVFDERIYEASASELLSVIRSQSDDAATIMLVGHNPGFEDLVGGLCGAPGHAANVRIPTAALACMELSISRWSDVGWGGATLLWLMVPKCLP